MAASRSRRIVDPVKNDERQAANHEDNSNDQENGCLWSEGDIKINYLSQLCSTVYPRNRIVQEVKTFNALV